MEEACEILGEDEFISVGKFRFLSHVFGRGYFARDLEECTWKD